jgi:hypothetical protein
MQVEKVLQATTALRVAVVEQEQWVQRLQVAQFQALVAQVSLQVFREVLQLMAVAVVAVLTIQPLAQVVLVEAAEAALVALMEIAEQ